MTEIANYPCTGCGCICDDVTLHVEEGRIVDTVNACQRGREYLLAANVDGEAVPIEVAIDQAAHLLAAAKLPLIAGATHATVEAQRAAIELADVAGACVDFGGPSERLFPDVGSATCSLGEIMNRADVVFVWRDRPHETHPRWRERYFRGQRVVVIGDDDTAKSLDADEFVSLDERDEFAALWHLRAAIRGRPIPSPWNWLAESLMTARPSVLLFGGNGRALEAAHALAADLNDFTRAYVVTLAGPGNPVGATQVLTWQTGYPAAVGLHRGYPRSFGREYSAERLIVRRECDLIVTIGIPTVATGNVTHITIAADPNVAATVAIPCASFPVSTAGTIFRSDGIALPLRVASPSSRPADFQVLRGIAQRLRMTRSGG